MKKDSIIIIERFQKGGLVAYSIDEGETYHPSVREAFEHFEREQIKKKIEESVQIYVEHLMPLIAEARSKVIKTGGRPNVMYIGDIFFYPKDGLSVSPMKMDTGCKVFGMKIIADFRVPFDKFYIMQGEL